MMIRSTWPADFLPPALILVGFKSQIYNQSILVLIMIPFFSMLLISGLALPKSDFSSFFVVLTNILPFQLILHHFLIELQCSMATPKIWEAAEMYSFDIAEYFK